MRPFSKFAKTSHATPRTGNSPGNFCHSAFGKYTATQASIPLQEQALLHSDANCQASDHDGKVREPAIVEIAHRQHKDRPYRHLRQVNCSVGSASVSVDHHRQFAVIACSQSQLRVGKPFIRIDIAKALPDTATKTCSHAAPCELISFHMGIHTSSQDGKVELDWSIRLLAVQGANKHEYMAVRKDRHYQGVDEEYPCLQKHQRSAG
jgi:hypothetical protein